MPAARSTDGATDHGAAVELALTAPLLVLMLLFLVAAGRLTLARQEVDSAARQAARAASLARSPQNAPTAATATARAALSGSRPSCRTFHVATDTTAFRPGGRVAFTVTCTAALSDLAMLGVPGTREITARFSAPLDRFR